MWVAWTGVNVSQDNFIFSLARNLESIFSIRVLETVQAKKQPKVRKKE